MFFVKQRDIAVYSVVFRNFSLQLISIKCVFLSPRIIIQYIITHILPSKLQLGTRWLKIFEFCSSLSCRKMDLRYMQF